MWLCLTLKVEWRRESHWRKYIRYIHYLVGEIKAELAGLGRVMEDPTLLHKLISSLSLLMGRRGCNCMSC